MYVMKPLIMQMTNWPRMTPDNPRSMPTMMQVVEVELMRLGDEQAAKPPVALQVDQDECRHHEHEEQASDARDDGRGELLAVLDGRGGSTSKSTSALSEEAA